MGLYLRRAKMDDMDLLFGWANDDAVRRNAFHTEKIAYEEHVKWFSKMMADESVHQYILCDDANPIGQLRLDIENKTGVVDYSICAERRGKGYGSAILKLVRQQLENDGTTYVMKLVGQVKYGNLASARAFERCGFSRHELPDFIQYELELGASG